MTAVLLTEEQRSALLELIGNFSAFFWGPNLAQCGAMLVKDYFRPLDPLAPVLVTEAREALEKLMEMVPGYPDAPSLFSSLEEEYIPLFVNARGGIAAPLYQSCYAETKDLPNANTLMGPSAVRMQQRLAAAGLSLDHNSNEPPDHLSIEVEYLYFLLQKGWGENATDLLTEAETFVKTELLAWSPRFVEQLLRSSPNSFYALAAVVLVAGLQLITDL